MDKMKHNPLMKSSRRGFALILTLSVLSIVIALSMVLLSYFNEVKEDSDTTKALIQANVYYADILEQFDRFKKKKSLFNRLYTYPVHLRTPDGRFILSLSCKPLAVGININWLAMGRKKGKEYLFQEAQELYETLVQQYDLKDSDRLLEMILNEIGLKKKFVPQAQSRLIQKKGIISYQQFLGIINRYEIEVDDSHVGRVPWRQYFSFSYKSDKIDIEYSSSKLISYLFDIDLKTVNEWRASLEKPSFLTFISENAGMEKYNEKKKLLAGNKFLGESRCRVNFDTGYRFTFDYIEGEAKYFEFFRKY